MAGKYFELTVKQAYSQADNATIRLKSSMIGLCSETDRIFRTFFDIDIFNKISESDFAKIKNLFPNFNLLNLEQFNRLLFTFISIRDLNAHLFFNKPIFIDEDIIEFIKKIINPQYSLNFGKEATIYGMLCVCLLFCNKNQLWSLNVDIIRPNIIKNINGENIAYCQKEFQLIHNSLTGNMNPLKPKNYYFLDSLDYTHFIENIKKQLTKLIFDLEKASNQSRSMSSKPPRTKELLLNFDCMKTNDSLLGEIVELRNIWLHGYRLFDKVKTADKEYVFDLDYLFKVLKNIKSTFNSKKYSPILEDIDNCGNFMIDFFALRLVELTYKIIDNRIFKSEKGLERIIKSVDAYSRMMRPEASYYKSAFELLDKEKIWAVNKNKFEDFKFRGFQGNKLTIYEFTFKNGVSINNEHYDVSEMVLVETDLPLNVQIKINGKYLEEYKTKKPNHYSFVDIYEVDL